ncbi:nucleotide exchange factor GrpE [Halocatena salina]|uniref:Protein GrpE n=1 Tax=Halocatena salina TaxID=2934340 RepID=A0A8T9ZYF1_9EURY|nr:nucleotide exchange factor GrpE [Halocatena salina]UPM41681.1 nucleotide exchange factor GrpE [Halocatena salina]
MSENDPVQDDTTTDDRRSEKPDMDDHPDDSSQESTSEESTEKTEAESEAETENGPSEELVERVEDSDPTDVATEIESLREQIDEHERTIEDLESSLKRKQADFKNYKKRMKKRREQERKRATEDLVTRIIDVRDNLKRGLDQDGDIREGIESTLNQFDHVLEGENVEEIAPEPGEDVDPQRHEVLMRVDSEQPPDAIDDVHRPGYKMAGKIIREAQVTVSDGESDEE